MPDISLADVIDTEEELETMRKRLQEQGSSDQQYGSGTRMQMKNSLTLSESEVKSSDSKTLSGYLATILLLHFCNS